MNKVIIKTLVGSRAHGLEGPESDYDYRGIFVAPTSEILKLGGKADQISWNEGETDDTAYELSKFLFMALKSNATVLEVLHGPIKETTPWGEELKSLFPYMWTSRGVLDAFRGYSLNQRKKFLEDKDNRPWKYAVAYIRVLLLGIELLRHGTITVNVSEQTKILNSLNLNPSLWFLPDLPGTDASASGCDGYTHTDISQALRDVRGEKYTKGQVIDWANQLELGIIKAYESNPNHTNDPDKLNEFLLRVRRDNW